MTQGELLAQIDRLDKQLSRFFGSFFRNSPVTVPQAQVIHYILKNYLREDIYQKDLEKYFSVRGSSMTILINALEGKGYVRREQVARDKRLRRIIPTENAKEIQSALENKMQFYNSVIFKGFSDEDLTQLGNLIDRMMTNLE